MSSWMLRRRLRAMESRHYWRRRSRTQKVLARVGSSWIGALSRWTDVSSTTRVGTKSVATSLISLCLPLVALALTQSAAKVSGNLPDWLDSLPGRTERILVWLVSAVPDTFDSAAWSTASLGVAGVFVAVYFATVTFVISTSYKDATRRLRDQIVRQPESRWYASFFTLVVVYVCLALALPLGGQAPTRLTLLMAGLSGALVVLTFGKVWVTLFVHLEPTSLLPQIHRDLMRSVHRAYKLGTEKRASLVAVRRIRAQIIHTLATLNDLVSLILDREFERSGNRGIAASNDPRIGSTLLRLRLLWDSYSQRKHSIMPLHGWNPTRTRSKDWFLSSYSEVNIALATGTTLAGSEVVDDLWYERRISDLTERLISGRDLRSTEHAIRGLPSLSRALSGRGQFEELRLWITATTFQPMASVIEYASDRERISTDNDVNLTHVPHLSREQHFAIPGEQSAHDLVDHVLLETLNAILGYADYIEQMRKLLPDSGATIAARSKQVAAGKVVLQTIEDLREALALEIDLEGERITSDASLTQLLARAVATETVDEIDHFVSFIEGEIWPWVIEVGEARSWAAGAALSRATEITEKLGIMISTARQLLEECEAVHRESDGRWPNTDLTAVSQRVMELRDRIDLPVARLAATVDSAPDSDRPDQFGWAYYRAHENLLRRVLARDPGDPEQLRQKVALLYWAGDVATQRLFDTVRRHDPRVINSYVAEPYLRFLQLCGISLAISEVAREPSVFAPFESLWLGLLVDSSRSSQLLGRAAATLAAESSLFALTPGGVDRSNIEIRANRALDELGVPRDFYDLGGFGYDEFDHSSSLSDRARRILSSVQSGHFEGMFYARWLRPTALAAGADVPSEAEQSLQLLDFEDEDEDYVD